MTTLIPTFEDVAARWGAAVRANREQVERFQETAPAEDFYAPIAASFKADPHRSGEDVLDHLRRLARAGETWIDIGGGAGRYALPIALIADSVTVVDPSQGMLALLREGAAEHGIDNVHAVEGRWPDAAGELSADVTFISHVGYDVEGIGPFVEAMEHAATKRCVAVLLDRAPASVASPFWPVVHGEARDELPGAREFIMLLLARGRLPAITLFERGAGTYGSVDEALRFLRHQLWVEPGSEKDDRLRAEIERRAHHVDDGIQLVTSPIPIAVIEWTPEQTG